MALLGWFFPSQPGRELVEHFFGNSLWVALPHVAVVSGCEYPPQQTPQAFQGFNVTERLMLDMRAIGQADLGPPARHVMGGGSVFKISDGIEFSTEDGRPRFSSLVHLGLCLDTVSELGNRLALPVRIGVGRGVIALAKHGGVGEEPCRIPRKRRTFIARLVFEIPQGDIDVRGAVRIDTDVNRLADAYPGDVPYRVNSGRIPPDGVLDAQITLDLARLGL